MIETGFHIHLLRTKNTKMIENFYKSISEKALPVIETLSREVACLKQRLKNAKEELGYFYEKEDEFLLRGQDLEAINECLKEQGYDHVPDPVTSSQDVVVLVKRALTDNPTPTDAAIRKIDLALTLAERAHFETLASQWETAALLFNKACGIDFINTAKRKEAVQSAVAAQDDAEDLMRQGPQPPTGEEWNV